ncbi:MAG: DUF4405 domain-containing protein [Eubacteriales bacterium]|nr:DUF4405 domain-containing protein [Eubacteriales bacterium]
MGTQNNGWLTAKQKRILKLIFDSVMLLLLVLMYKKQVISMAFHEIGGLALIGLFVVHHLVNARWIGASSRRLFTRGMPGLVRARYLVDVLLLIAFLTVCVSGILISKVVFSIHVAGNFQALHSFAATLAVLLMGVHLGLHTDYIFGKLLRRGSGKAAKVALAVVIAAMIAFGGYSLFTTSFLRYLAAPVQTARFAHGEIRPSGDIALDGSTGERPTDLSELSGAASGKNDSGNGFGGNEGSGERGKGDSTNAALLIAQYASIMALFGASTYGIVRLTGRKAKKKLSGNVPA